MRWGAALLLVGAALGLAACKPAGSPAAPAKGSTYACITSSAGKTAMCAQYFGVPVGTQLNLVRQACLEAPGQSFGSTCPTERRIACCAIRRRYGVGVDACFYKAGPRLDSAADECAKEGGVWSVG